MRCLNFLFLNILFFHYPSLAEALIPHKVEILKQSKECLEDSRKQVCKNLIMQMERVQLIEFERGRFKCQSTILGLQTEIIRAYFFEKSQKLNSAIMIPYVTKNC